MGARAADNKSKGSSWAIGHFWPSNKIGFPLIVEWLDLRYNSSGNSGQITMRMGTVFIASDTK
jgi:hypothetical protein